MRQVASGSSLFEPTLQLFHLRAERIDHFLLFVNHFIEVGNEAFDLGNFHFQPDLGRIHTNILPPAIVMSMTD